MKPKVFIAKKIPREVEEYLASYCEYRKWNGEEPIPRAHLLEEVKNVEGLLISGGKIDKELLEHAPGLKVVSNISVGYNNFDLEAMKERKVLGTNTPSVLDDTVADLVFGLMLAVARRIPELDKFVKEGKWQQGSDEPFWGIDVHHSTLGIIGMGRIGEAIAKRGKWGFGMEVLYYNRRRKPDVEASLGAKYCPLEQLLGEADYVVLMTPLTPETAGLMGAREFSLMKENAVFINASRGETVNEEALIAALVEGRIWGAGLDVFSREPVDPSNPLLKLPNVVTVPHIGSATAKTRFAMAQLAAHNLVKALQGEVPPNLVEELKELMS